MPDGLLPKRLVGLLWFGRLGLLLTGNTGTSLLMLSVGLLNKFDALGLGFTKKLEEGSSTRQPPGPIACRRWSFFCSETADAAFTSASSLPDSNSFVSSSFFLSPDCPSYPAFYSGFAFRAETASEFCCGLNIL